MVNPKSETQSGVTEYEPEGGSLQTTEDGGQTTNIQSSTEGIPSTTEVQRQQLGNTSAVIGAVYFPLYEEDFYILATISPTNTGGKVVIYSNDWFEDSYITDAYNWTEIFTPPSLLNNNSTWFSSEDACLVRREDFGVSYLDVCRGDTCIPFDYIDGLHGVWIARNPKGAEYEKYEECLLTYTDDVLDFSLTIKKVFEYTPIFFDTSKFEQSDLQPMASEFMLKFNIYYDKMVGRPRFSVIMCNQRTRSMPVPDVPVVPDVQSGIPSGFGFIVAGEQMVVYDFIVIFGYESPIKAHFWYYEEGQFIPGLLLKNEPNDIRDIDFPN